MAPCGFKTRSGTRCTRESFEGGYCWQHTQKLLKVMQRKHESQYKPPPAPHLDHHVEPPKITPLVRPPPLLRTTSTETQKAILELVGEVPKKADRPF
jgi:hypothetical protein